MPNVNNKHRFLTDLKARIMAKHIVIERPNGAVTIVRSELDTPSETPLTEYEQIINELYSKVKNLGLFSVSNPLFCGVCEEENDHIEHADGSLECEGCGNIAKL